jgi:hypothetical protein
MFFDQLYKRNAMVKSVLAFEEVGQVVLAKKAISFAQAPNAMIQVSFLAILTVET